MELFILGLLLMGMFGGGSDSKKKKKKNRRTRRSDYSDGLAWFHDHGHSI